jgi:hypothetical protein
MEEVCASVPKRHCFDYDRIVCDRKPTTTYESVTWQNERLEKLASNNKTKCQMVTRCNYTTEERVEQRQMPRNVCENNTQTQEFCQNVPVTEYRVSAQERRKRGERQVVVSAVLGSGFGRFSVEVSVNISLSPAFKSELGQGTGIK